MNKSAIIKILGLLLVPFILMVAGAFFLYPQLNEEKYNEIVSTFEEQQEKNFENDLQNERKNTTGNRQELGVDTFIDSLNVEKADSLNSFIATDSLRSLAGQTGSEFQRFEQNEIRLHTIIDSLYVQIEKLEVEIDSLRNPVAEKAELDPQEFAERVKSLLNLEEEELSPILAKMSQEQIVRLYNGGGTIQRQKILRSLDADKAAELMTEIML